MRRAGPILLSPLISLSLLLATPQLLAAERGASRPDALTAADLTTSERFWPYRVALVEAWQPEGGVKPLRAGTSGVLIRVEATGLARIDFAKAGKYAVPVEKTDLLANANRIRRGELEKAEPNFIHAIAPRLVDSAAATMVALGPEATAPRPGFLCVFADPDAPGFEALAAALAPLRDRHGVMTLLFAQGAHPDARTRDRLRALEWTVPFVYDFLSEPYTTTLLAGGTPMPALLLQTSEGRLVFQGPATPEVVPALTTALDQAFSTASVSSPEAVR